MTSDREAELRRYNLSISELCECVRDLALHANQLGAQADEAKLGGILVGLKRAVYRVEHGTLEGFATSLVEADDNPAAKERNALAALVDSLKK